MSDYVKGTNTWRVMSLVEDIVDNLSTISETYPEAKDTVKDIDISLSIIVQDYATRYATMLDNKHDLKQHQ